MKNLLYSLRNLTRTPGTQALKAVSLTLGLAVSLLLFSKVAYELSFDRFFPDAGRIYQIRAIVPAGSLPGMEGEVENHQLSSSFAPTMADEFPQVEAVTRLAYSPQRFSHGEQVFPQTTVLADEHFFEVFDPGIVAGDPKQLRTLNDVLISERMARTIFGNEDPIGKTLTLDNEPITVQAVFRDVPPNSHLRFDAIVPLDDATRRWGWYMGWNGGMRWQSYVKLRPGVDPTDVEAALPAFTAKHTPWEEELGEVYLLAPLKEIHLRGEGVRSTVVLYSVLAVLALFIAALNYVLISVSSLTKRSRTIAVQKVNGARDHDIFGGFLIETALLLLCCAGLAVLLIFAFRAEIERFTAESLSTLFAPDRLAALAGVVALFFVVAGVIPGILFARIPVRQAFAMSGVNKRGWKKALLFTQFLGVSFALVFLLIIGLQYRYLLDKELGYDHERIVHLSLQNVTTERYHTLAADLSRMPFVEGMALSDGLFFDGFGGWSGIERPDGETFWPRYTSFDHRMLPLYGITPVQGENFREDSPAGTVLINRALARQMGWDDVPVGEAMTVQGQTFTVAGVLPDFQLGHLATGLQPLLVFPRTMRDSTASSARVSIRLSEVTPENIERLNGYFEERFPDQQQTVVLYDQSLRDQYVEEEYFRNAVLAGAAITLLIALMGLIGYVNDEVRLRRREIAVRRVHGATVADVLRVVSKGIMALAGAAAVPGCVLAFVSGRDWLANFANRIGLSPWIFVVGALTVLAVIAATIVVRAWRAANENPVNSIKTE